MFLVKFKCVILYYSTFHYKNLNGEFKKYVRKIDESYLLELKYF